MSRRSSPATTRRSRGLLASDVLVSHQPHGGNASPEVAWYRGRQTTMNAWAPALYGSMALDMRMVEFWVNNQPAVATYARLPGTTPHRAFSLTVLRTTGDRIAEVVNLSPDQFPALGLPMELAAADMTTHRPRYRATAGRVTMDEHTQRPLAHR